MKEKEICASKNLRKINIKEKDIKDSFECPKSNVCMTYSQPEAYFSIQIHGCIQKTF